MEVVKVLNNSLILSVDDQNNEVILMGKGLGFNSMVGDSIEESKVEKMFVLQNKELTKEYIRAIENTPVEYVNVINNVIEEASKSLKLSDQVYITLLDHISFAIERYQKGVVLQNRMLWEIQKFHPVEYEMGLKAVKIINKELKIDLPEEEAGNIAFHFVNAQTEEKDMGKTVLSIKMLKDISNIIQYNLSISNKNSIYYTRLVTHLQFFIQRLLEGKLSLSSEDFIYTHIVNEHQKEYNCAVLIRDYVKNILDIKISNNEMLYLIIHMARIVKEES
jgi:beta-glucoside operon transcriptional antiterminator